MVPLNEPARNALIHLQATAKGEYVFVKKDGSPYRKRPRTAFENACKRAGLKDVSPHCLRHTFASRLVMAGVDLKTVQELGGWADLKMLMRYAHLSPGHKRQAVEKLGAFHNAFHNTGSTTLAVVS